MKVLPRAEAQSFLMRTTPPTGSRVSTVHNVYGRWKSVRHIRSGSPAFSELREAMQEDAERNITLALSTMAHSLEGVMKGSTPWAGVGFYYVSFYCAHALTIMSGCWFRNATTWIDVERHSPTLGFRLHATQDPSIARKRGPHKDFWVFYQGVASNFSTEVDPKYQWAVVPSRTKVDRLHDLRKTMNYDIDKAFDTSLQQVTAPSGSSPEQWLPGPSATLCRYAQAFLAYTCQIANNLGVHGAGFPHGFRDRRDFVAARLDGAHRSWLKSEIYDLVGP